MGFLFLTMIVFTFLMPTFIRSNYKRYKTTKNMILKSIKQNESKPTKPAKIKCVKVYIKYV